MSKTTRQAQGSAVDVGTRPHGLPADVVRPIQKTRGKAAPRSLVDQQAEGAQVVSPGVQPIEGEANGITSAQRALDAKASGVFELLPYHYLELTDCEFLNLLSAVEQDRNATRKAIKKGKAVEADMESTATLWEKLQEVRAIREHGYLRMYQRGTL